MVFDNWLNDPQRLERCISQISSTICLVDLSKLSHRVVFFWFGSVKLSSKEAACETAIMVLETGAEI